jgi:hypothetical protein
MLLEESLLVTWVKLVDNKPTVCLDITSLVVDSYGYNSGQIEQRIAHALAMHWTTYGELAARTKHRHSPHVQPIVHVR